MVNDCAVYFCILLSAVEFFGAGNVELAHFLIEDRHVLHVLLLAYLDLEPFVGLIKTILCAVDERCELFNRRIVVEVVLHLVVHSPCGVIFQVLGNFEHVCLLCLLHDQFLKMLKLRSSSGQLLIEFFQFGAHVLLTPQHLLALHLTSVTHLHARLELLIFFKGTEGVSQTIHLSD